MKSRFQSLVVMVLVVAGVVAVPCFGITNTSLDVAGTVSWSFEDYTNGADIVSNTNDSWYGESGNLVATTNIQSSSSAGFPLTTNHNVIAELTANVTNMVVGGLGKSIWLDHLVQPRRWDQDEAPTDIPTDAQMAYYFNTNGHVVLYHRNWNGGDPGNASNIWTEIPSPVIGTSDWVRVSVNMDYDSNFDNEFVSLFYRIMINGILVTNAAAIIDPYAPNYNSPGSYFTMATHDGGTKMNAISLHGTGFFDDFVVTTNAPTITTSYIIASTIDPTDASGGTISPLGNISVEEGGSTSFTATAETYWLIEKVVVSHNGVTTTNLSPTSPFTTNLVNVTQAGSIFAKFVAQTTTDGVPVWWMADYGLEAEDPASGNNPDMDALTTKQEWLASTHPTNASNFEIANTWQEDGTNYVEWVCTGVDPALPAIDVMRSTNLTDGFVYHASKDREEGTNRWSEVAPDVATFYRIAATNAP